MTRTRTIGAAMWVWKRLPEKFPAEVIDNKLHVSPSPNTYHQQICGRIYHTLRSYLDATDLGEVWVAPVDVFLEDHRKSVVAPDIIFVSHENNLKTERRGLFGVPDLLMEILSPGNRKYDLTTKKALYQRTGVKEYWVIDPETKEAQGYILKNGAYGDPLFMKSKIHISTLDKEIAF